MYLPCTGCDSYHLQPFGRTVAKNKSVRYLPDFGPIVAQECIDCGKKYNMGGPIWSAPIHDQEWVTSILEDVMAMKDGYPAYDRILLSLQHFQRNFLMCHCFSVCTTFVRLSSALPHHSHSTPVCIIGVFRSSKSREKPESILSKLNQRTASKLDDVEVSVSSVKSSEDENDIVNGKPTGVLKAKIGVLGMESAVVIIDDSVKVCPHHKLNLIVVERWILADDPYLFILENVFEAINNT